jgi:hypothetical protein
MVFRWTGEPGRKGRKAEMKGNLCNDAGLRERLTKPKSAMAAQAHEPQKLTILFMVWQGLLDMEKRGITEMNNIFRSKLAILRLLLMLVNIIGLSSFPQERSNLDWGGCFVISLIFALFVYGFLLSVQYKQHVDWSEPYSLLKPFFPMNRYPLRFCLVASHSFMIGGILAMLVSVIHQNQREAVGGTFFFTGLFIYITLKIWIRLYGRKV